MEKIKAFTKKRPQKMTNKEHEILPEPEKETWLEYGNEE